MKNIIRASENLSACHFGHVCHRFAIPGLHKHFKLHVTQHKLYEKLGRNPNSWLVMTNYELVCYVDTAPVAF